MKPPAPPISRSRLAPLLRPLDALLSASSSGSILLLASSLIALAWANSPLNASYENFWQAKLEIRLGRLSLAMSLQHLVNDGLMAIFFLLVGLEIKRELLIGELNSLRRAMLPVIAALGGMIVPASIYFALNHRPPASSGWGIPMATDIAFAVGVLAVVAPALPKAVKIFLLAVAIVDDLAAVLIIAIFYTGQISPSAMGVAAILFAALVLLAVLRVHRPAPYLILGLGLWAAMLFSGVHATIAGVLLAFTIPATRQIEELPYVQYVREMLGRFEEDVTAVPDRITESQIHALSAIDLASRAVQTPMARVEHSLLRPVNFLILPLFALANAGVSLHPSQLAAGPRTILLGVLLGLLVGKPLGVLLASWVAVKTKIAALPQGATWRQLSGVAVLCGIGFTMSLFIAQLAFGGDEAFLSAAKLGIFAASLLSAGAGALLLARAGNFGE